MRIRSLLVAASLGGASLLAGCGGAGDEAPTPEASAALAPGSTAETTRTFVEMLRVTRDCVS
jgi:hypothetical protein